LLKTGVIDGENTKATGIIANVQM